MKTTIQLVTSLLAVGALLAATVAQATTDVADLPLKASVLAKPNVIFAMDDSGSMDWEVLLDTSSGLLWWNGSTAWDAATGKPLKTSSLLPYGYVLPVGTATGGQIYAYNNTYGQAVPPTNQFAWVRASRFNPLYYDSRINYAPWAPAYLGAANKTYAAAPAGAALSHPVYPSGPTLKLDGAWSSGSSNFSSDGYRFRVQAGMKVPIGASVYASSTSSGVCSGTTTRTLTAELTVASGNACWASIPYYPATFWNAESCTIGTDCVLGPDGTTKLKRYEIKSGTTSYPSGRTYVNEMQNFANWFSYHRKRKLMLAGSMGQVLEDLTGLRLGVVPFNARSTVTMFDTDATAASQNGRTVAGLFYTNAMAANGTPTHDTVKFIGGEFNTNTNVVKYACQRNSMFIVTDGFSNTTSISVPTYSAALFGATTPYKTTPTGSLADLALSYYTNRLRASGGSVLAAGKVPPSSSDAPNADKNTNLHVNTYAITLGVRGSLWPNTVDPFVTAPTWPTPVADDPSMIDDQWHGTVNGRGLMYLATNPTDTSAGIQAVLNDIISQTGAQGGVAVSTVNLSRGDSRAYFGTYDPAGWAGDVTAHPINPATGIVDAATESWSASTLLTARPWSERVIASWNGSAGVGFTASAVGTTVNPGAIYGTTADVMNYLRGERSNEGTLFRKRLSLLGGIINSEPAVQRDQQVVYVQSGEGMLHAFDTAGTTPGKELWAFVPRTVLANIGSTSERGYVFSTQLDGSPTVGAAGSSKTLLVAGMGSAGRGFHAIDISAPRNLTESQLAAKVQWEFPAVGDGTTQAKVGQSLGRPRIVKTIDDGYVVLVTSGYNSTVDGKGRMWMLNATSGAVLHEFVTADGTLAAEGGLAQVSAYSENDGSVRYVFGGDLLGNLWKFDLKLKGAPFKLAVLKNAANDLQPVTAAPELVEIAGKRVVIVGTGRVLDITDFGNAKVQSVYAIADGVTTLANARSSLVAQIYNPGTDTITANPVSFDTGRGWYVDLPAGQQANTQPTIAYGAVAFTTNTNGGTDCTASSRLYVLNVLTGGAFAGAGYVSSEISATANSSGVTALATTGQKIVGSGQDANGNPWEREIVTNDAIKPAKNSWREIRRQ